MSDRQTPQNPADFAQTTPGADELGERRTRIDSALASLQAHVGHLSDDVKELKGSISELRRDQADTRREIRDDIKDVVKKIDLQKEKLTGVDNQVAEARGAFWTSKYAVGVLGAAAAFILANLGSILRWVLKH